MMCVKMGTYGLNIEYYAYDEHEYAHEDKRNHHLQGYAMHIKATTCLSVSIPTSTM